jgi:hypothetical protein
MDFDAKLNRFNNVSDLYFLLKKDFDRSKSIKALDKENLKCSIEKRGVVVEYFFANSYTVRTQQDRIDTFKCSAEPPVFKWQDKEISDNQHLVDELQLDILSMSEPTRLVVYKQYDASSLIETVEKDTTSERN